MRPSVFYISPCAAVVPSLTILTHPTSFSLCVSLLAMSHLDFHVYPGSGQHLHEHYGYSQSVKVGNQVVISGQGESPQKGAPREIDCTLGESLGQGESCVGPPIESGSKGLIDPERLSPPSRYFRGLADSPFTGGWEPLSHELTFPSDLTEQVGNAFKNCENALKGAGASLGQVYKVSTGRSTSVDKSKAEAVLWN